jgi:hypothetical protein
MLPHLPHPPPNLPLAPRDTVPSVHKRGGVFEVDLCAYRSPTGEGLGVRVRCRGVSCQRAMKASGVMAGFSPNAGVPAQISRSTTSSVPSGSPAHRRRSTRRERLHALRTFSALTVNLFDAQFAALGGEPFTQGGQCHLHRWMRHGDDLHRWRRCQCLASTKQNRGAGGREKKVARVRHVGALICSCYEVSTSRGDRLRAVLLLAR